MLLLAKAALLVPLVGLPALALWLLLDHVSFWWAMFWYAVAQGSVLYNLQNELRPTGHLADDAVSAIWHAPLIRNTANRGQWDKREPFLKVRP